MLFCKSFHIWKGFIFSANTTIVNCLLTVPLNIDVLWNYDPLFFNIAFDVVSEAQDIEALVLSQMKEVKGSGTDMWHRSL